MAPRDLQSKNLIIAKGILFILLGCGSAAMVVIEGSAWLRRLVLVAICIWASCRACYFSFYVLEHYIDSGVRYSGLLSALRHCAG